MAIDPVQILWTPAGINMPSLDTKQFIDTHDGDTPNIRVPVRMLSIDTPETTAQTSAGAARVDEKLAQLAEWISDRPDDVPTTSRYAAYLMPKIATGAAGTLQFTQGSSAAEFAKTNFDARLTKPDGSKRTLFVRTADAPFDPNGRLLAYLAPNYTKAERETLSREERATFNLDMIRTGWAATFILYPSIPGELDLPILLHAADEAVTAARGIWGDPNTLLAYEYRMAEKLYQNTKAIIVDQKPPQDPWDWRERYCVDMTTRTLYGPEDYFEIAPTYRLWLWQVDVQAAVSELNLTPSRRLVGAD
jgi:endonuclease YncB( thermonuclease family)